MVYSYSIDEKIRIICIYLVFLIFTAFYDYLRHLFQNIALQKNQEIKNYTNVITHDLKNPLAGINNGFKVLKNLDLSTYGEEIKEIVELGIESSEYMQEMIEELLYISRSKSSGIELNIENIDFKALVERVLFLQKKNIKDRNISISVDISNNLKADKNGVQKIFMNLIGNAINYTINSTNPKITISSVLEDDTCTCMVQDNGIGIAGHEQDKIFNEFARGKNARQFAGTGLGLAITREIVNAHNGRIWVESKEGVGSAFYFTLPQN